LLTHNADGEWEAYEFAKHYQELGYFGHALEILLHNVLEDEAESDIGFEEGIFHSLICINFELVSMCAPSKHMRFCFITK
jgi:hypothetical protein